MRFPILLSGLLCLATAAAAQPAMVRDLDERHLWASSQPRALGSIGNITLFSAIDPTRGRELWKTDGTAEGTVVLRDIRPGKESGLPSDRIGGRTVGNRVIFHAFDAEHGEELWSTDGTSEGTVLLADIYPGPQTSRSDFLMVIGSVLYFRGIDPVHGSEVWRTDGTPAGTRLVADVYPGDGGYYPRALGRIDRKLIFDGSSGSKHGAFITDGTEEGTRFLSPELGISGTSIGVLSIFIAAEVESKTYRLVRTDGTPAGTSLVRAGFRSGVPAQFHEGDGIAYFVADDGVKGAEVWRSDGTAEGTVMLADLAPGSGSSDILMLNVVNGRLLFWDRGNGGLWSSDGTPEGTRMIEDLSSASIFGCVFDGSYYFSGYDAARGSRLWKSDGTDSGTVIVASPGDEEYAGVYPDLFVPRDDGVFFVASDGPHGAEPWLSDGTAPGTRMIRDLAPQPGVGSNPREFANLGGKLAFIAQDNDRSWLWLSDGTYQGTQPLGLPPNQQRTVVDGVASGGLYFFTYSPVPSYYPELWRTDGTLAGTFRLLGSQFGFEMVPFRGGILFMGGDGEPWFSDGSSQGTRQLAETLPGDNGRALRLTPNIVIDDVCYFALYWPKYTSDSLPASGELWRTDGTVEGTRRVDLPLENMTYPVSLARDGDSLYMLVLDAYVDIVLLRMNLTSGQTTLVRRFESKGPTALWNVQGEILFAFDNALWKTDGTDAGTVVVSNMADRRACSDDPRVGGGAWFLYQYAKGLWRTDGTGEGTCLLRESALMDVGYTAHGRYFFADSDDVHGTELWVSDGTRAGTRLLYDLNPGVESGSPYGFFALNGRLFFTAQLFDNGRELWSMPLECSSGPCTPKRRSAGH